MIRLKKIWLLLTHLGPGWVLFRLRYALRKKSGAPVRRAPLRSWDRAALPSKAANEPTLFSLRPPTGPGGLGEAEQILAGSFRLFSFHEKAAGFPPDWHSNPLTCARSPGDCHWSQIGDFGHGDIKGIWELSRFPWAWPLARAFAHARDERYATAFWTLFEDWMAHNPPNRGANWMCGQEATFRLMAASFARHVLAGAAATTPERVERYQAFVLTTGHRIRANLDYALSQSNNHGVSECIGLITAALLVPAAPDSAAWLRQGLEALRRQLAVLVYPDGAFAQHSATYHRVLLHDILWCVHLMRAAGQPVPVWLTIVGQRALAFIDALLTPDTGRVPLYGANDGANILPLADADYSDFRPLVQAGYAVLHGVRRLPLGPWDEAALWLAEKGAFRKEDFSPRPARLHAREGGCFVWRHGDARLFLRCPEKFRHRPSQADLLHVDLEWRGQPIAIDAGTFSYNTPGVFSGAMKEAALHNSVTFDGAEPLAKAGRFLYLPWPKGAAGMHRDDRGDYFEATHEGWAKHGARHVRQCRNAGEDSFIISDRLSKRSSGKTRLHWLLADVPYDFDTNAGGLVLHTAQGDYAVNWNVPAGSARATLVRADPGSARGWWSPYYYHAAPALSLSVEFDFSGSIEITTIFAPV